MDETPFARKTKLDSQSCLVRATEHIVRWEAERLDAVFLIYAALEMRLALESFLITRSEAITGKKQKPKSENTRPGKLIERMLKTDPDSMQPQQWAIGASPSLHEAPTSWMGMRYTVLPKDRAKYIFDHLGNYLHATIKLHGGAIMREFWDKQCQELKLFHAELVEATSGLLSKPVKIVWKPLNPPE